MHLRYIKLNLKDLVKNHLGVFLLIMFSEILTAVCIMFAYGLLMDNQQRIENMYNAETFFMFDLPNVKNLPERVSKFLEIYDDQLEELSFDIKVKTKDGVERVSSAYYMKYKSEDKLSGYTCFIGNNITHLVDKGELELNGIKYKVVKTLQRSQMWCDLGISALCIPSEATGTELRLYYTKRLSAKDVDEICNNVVEIFEGENAVTPWAEYLLENQENNMFYAYAFLIVLIVVMNLSLYFKYIVELRRKQIRIFSVCGATGEDICNIFLFENLTELVIGYTAAAVLFKFVLLNIIERFTPGFSDYYTLKMYLLTFGIFVVGSLLILMLLISPDIRRAAAAGREE